MLAGVSSVEVALFGTGAVAVEVASVLARSGHTVVHLFDHEESGVHPLIGLPIQRADAPSIDETTRLTVPVVIAVFNPHANVRGIEVKLGDAGWSTCISFVRLFVDNETEFSSRFWLSSAKLYKEEHERICAARSLFREEKSLKLFDALIDFRRTGNYQLEPAVDWDDQYVPIGLPRWTEPMSLIDGGAFDGDSIRGLAGAGYRFRSIRAFEPDPGNYRLLQEFLSSGAVTCSDLQAYSVGLWDEETALTFAAQGKESSGISGSGTMIIDCTSLDRVLDGLCPTLIKLDIEGAEVHALRGAASSISAHSPDLAVCLYHCPTDLWEIPTLVASLNSGYSFFLRVHRYSAFEVVLYAFDMSRRKLVD